MRVTPDRRESRLKFSIFRGRKNRSQHLMYIGAAEFRSPRSNTFGVAHSVEGEERFYGSTNNPITRTASRTDRPGSAAARLRFHVGIHSRRDPERIEPN